jgi:TetR/AcrR family transcriptional repressor of nem operon
VTAPAGSRTRLVDAMRALALAKGFAATSVDEVCDRADVSKGSFYHHFSSKDDIAHAAADAYFGELVAALTQGPFAGVADPVDRLHGFVEHAAVVCAGPVVRHGCLLGSFALDLAETHPPMRAQLSAQFTQLADHIGALLSAAGDATGVAVDARRLADHLLTVIEGSIVLAKAHDDPAIIGSQIALVGEHLHLLFDRKDRP